MGHKVLKPFPYAEDGHSTRHTTVDEILGNVHPDHVAGLVAEGYIADATAAETASKIAGEAVAATDLAGAVDSDKAVHEEIDTAKAGISDGKIGLPEAMTIVDAHSLEPLPAAEVVQAEQDEKAAHEAGDTKFDPKSPDAVAAASEKVAAGADPFDHDQDGTPGGSLPKAKRAKS